MFLNRSLLTWLYYLCSCIVVLTAGSCSDESDAAIPHAVPAHFSTTIAGNDSVSTRVVDNTWTGNEVIGIHMATSSSSLPTSAAFSTYKPSSTSGGTSISLIPTATAQTIYYPVDGTSRYFFAFSPHKAPNSSNQVTYAVSNQSTKATMESNDFVWAKTGAYNKNSSAVPMTFAHKQSKIEVKVTAGTGVTSTDVSNLALTLQSFPYSTVYALATGAGTTSTSTTTVTPYKSASGVWQAILSPHTGTSFTARKFVFTFNGQTFTYTLPTSQNFVSGYKYTYNLVLTTSGITPTSVTVGNWTGGAANWDGKYALTTSSETATYSNWGSAKTITIKTTASTTPAITNTASSWLTHNISGATSSGGWYTRTLTLTAAENTTTSSRSGTVTITVEGLSVQIAASQTAFSVPAASTDGMSNCYIVPPGATITFPVTRAYTGGVLDSDYNGTFTVARQWYSGSAVTYSVSGSGRNAYIKVKAPSTKGNALIALKQGGVTVWSYHIWVTDMALTNTWTPNYGSTATKKTFMDRNLGATENTLSVNSRGLFYQWGRKDPFPKEETLTGFSIAASGRVSMGTTIKNPGAFNPYGGDWNSTRNDNLWNSTSNTKTIYDPCPLGWRVPPSGANEASPWYGITTSTGTWTSGSSTTPAGWTWGSSSWPAAGCRDNGSGALDVVGSYGRYWSATPSSNLAYYLYFISGSMGPSNYSYRAYGFPVRCVVE